MSRKKKGEDGAGAGEPPKRPSKPRKPRTPVAGTAVTAAASGEPQTAAVDRPPAPAAAEPAPAAAAAAAEPSPAAAAPAVEPPPPRSSPAAAAAALEAASIVSEMVDIDTPTGAVIAAAAAASAAAAAHDAERPPPGDPSAFAEPSTTVRLSRDRILRALSEGESSATSEPRPRARTERAATNEPLRATTSPGELLAPADLDRPVTAPGELPPALYSDDEEFDPVQVAAAAIQRLRKRARTDLAELTVHYHRHDILVVLLALVIIFVAGRIYTNLVTPPNVTFASHGLTFDHAAGWLPEPSPLPAPRLVHDLAGLGEPAKDDTVYHVTLTSPLESTARIEVLVDRQLAWRNIVTSLDLDRRTRYGELYALEASSVESIEEHEWLRTEYRYAHGAKGDVPRVDRAVEYATIDRDQSYVVTLFGTPAQLARIEDVVAPSLRVATHTGAPLVPQTSRLLQPDYTTAVARAFDSTVMIVAADVIDGRLKPRAGGSGVIVGADGSILTSYHIVHDKTGRLHDVFVIGRYSSLDQAPQLWCAGRPSRSKLQRDLDLALLKCDMDLDGRAWTPATAGGIWPTLPEATAADVKQGQRLWVLGYPDVGGGGLTLTSGEVEGWTGADGTPGHDYIKTNIATSNGSSGGPVVDDQGRLVGIAVAMRTTATATGGVVEVTKHGTVRPLGAASDLLAIALAGWTPREGHTDVSLAPTAVEAVAEGVHISTKVQDAGTEAPIRDALVMVLRPGVKAAAVDINRLDDQVLSWGQSNAAGEVLLKQPVPVPGTYTVMVVASGYEPLIGQDALHLDAKTPQSFDPWGQIWLRSR